MSITDASCEANTERSGSATVINAPIINAMANIVLIFFDFARPDPTSCPMGVIATSAPRLNMAIPMTRHKPEAKKMTSSLCVKFTIGVKFRSTVSRHTGRMERSDSFSFQINVYSHPTPAMVAN